MPGLPEVRRFLVLTPSIGGADGLSALSRQVVRALTTDGPRPAMVEVWALDGAGLRDPSESTPMLVRLAGGGRSTLVLWTLMRAAKPLHDVTVVVMHAHLAPLASILALRGAQTAIFLVGVEVWRRLKPAERFAFERADRLIAISDHTARRFRAANPHMHARSIAVCRPGVGAAPPSSDRTTTVRTFALIVGRLWREERYKGHDWLIDVWPAVRERVADATLIVVGDGDDRMRLERRVAANRLKDAIQFTGLVDDDDLASLYRTCAFFVMPSAGEGFGLAYLEAMRAGKPCIALHGAADEIIDDGISGVLVEAGQNDQLSQAIVRLFTDTSWRERLGAAAAARVSREFTQEEFAARLRPALGLSASPVNTVVPAARTTAPTRVV
jgi:phosphatidyl-myo-inositol dimannoside synthase